MTLLRKDPCGGLRVIWSVEAQYLSISRAIFMQGATPEYFMEALNVSLFLSASEKGFCEAVIL
jgi:5'-nucleotidase